jgi:hypothetical protein
MILLIETQYRLNMNQNHDIDIGKDHGNWDILIIARFQG